MNIKERINYYRNLPPEIFKIGLLNIELNPEAFAYRDAGDEAFEQDNFYLAIEYFSKSLVYDPTNNYPLTKRGQCFKMLKEYDKALKDFFVSKGIDDNYENNSAIAECYLFLNDFSEAADYFNISISKLEELEKIDEEKMLGINYDATKARTLNNLAICYFSLKRFDLAIDSTTKGIKANPNYSSNYCIRGMSFLSQGNQKQGRSDLQKAAELGDHRALAILSQI